MNKRSGLVIALLLLLVTSAYTLRHVNTCQDWQVRYSHFIYSEWIKNAPFLYSTEDIEDIIGERPQLCGQPKNPLSDANIKRFRREGVGPNHFVDEKRAAQRRVRQSSLYW